MFHHLLTLSGPTLFHVAVAAALQMWPLTHVQYLPAQAMHMTARLLDDTLRLRLRAACCTALVTVLCKALKISI